MNLVIAVQQLAAVINVRQTDAASPSLAATAEEHTASTSISTGVIEELRLYSVPEFDAVTSGNGTPEVEQTSVRTNAKAVELCAFLRRQHPDADTITIRE